MAYNQSLNDVAEWFKNSGMDNLSGKQIAKILREWRPEHCCCGSSINSNVVLGNGIMYCTVCQLPKR